MMIKCTTNACVQGGTVSLMLVPVTMVLLSTYQDLLHKLLSTIKWPFLKFDSTTTRENHKRKQVTYSIYNAVAVDRSVLRTARSWIPQYDNPEQTPASQPASGRLAATKGFHRNWAGFIQHPGPIITHFNCYCVSFKFCRFIMSYWSYG